MSKLIFINLPVSDLKKSTAFYTAIGGTLNPQFSDGTVQGWWYMIVQVHLHQQGHEFFRFMYVNAMFLGARYDLLSYRATALRDDARRGGAGFVGYGNRIPQRLCSRLGVGLLGCWHAVPA